MSVTHAIGHTFGDTLRHIGDAIPTPAVVFAGLTFPVWFPPLRDWSQVAELSVPMLACCFLALKIWAELRGNEKASNVAEHGGNLASSLGKLGSRIGIGLLAVFGVFAVLALVTRRANAASADASGGADADLDGCPAEAPPWFKLLWTFRGIQELKGRKRNNPTILAFYADAGHPEIDNDEVSWCAAVICAMFERCGYSSPKTLAARGFLQWGKEVTSPRVGDVVVFWRGSRNGWQGHVALFVRETATYVYVLGGNQSDSVNVQRFPKSRVLGYRRPRHFLESKTVAAGIGTAVTGGVGLTAQVPHETAHPIGGPVAPAAPLGFVDTWLNPIRDAIQPIAPYSRQIALACAVLTVAGGIYVIYERNVIRKQTGR